MTETLTCPADGCDYSGVQSSVLGHYSGKQDESHSGGYQHAKTLLNGDSGSTESTDTSSRESNTGGNPVFGSADPDGGDDDSTDDVMLPCGCEGYDPTEAPDKPFQVTCSSCSSTFRVTE